MSAFPFDAVIFDMDGVIVDTEYYYLGETAAFAKELGLNLTQEELNGQVGTSHQFFLHMLVDWFERAGKGHFTGEEALARWDDWAHKRPRDYQALINPGAVDTIRELPRRGVRVALASSSPMDSIEEVLNACGLSDAFEYVVSGEGEQARARHLPACAGPAGAARESLLLRRGFGAWHHCRQASRPDSHCQARGALWF